MESATSSKRQRFVHHAARDTEEEEEEEEMFDVRSVNKDLDIDSKIAALKVSLSVVCLLSRTGGKNLCRCSGTVVECEHKQESGGGGGGGGEFVATILTSANLLRFPAYSRYTFLAPDITVEVYLSKGKPLKGEVLGYDFHYNLAIIKITTDYPLPTAILTDIDVSMPLTPTPLLIDSKPFGLRPHTVDSSLFKLRGGDKVIALARTHTCHCLLVESGMQNQTWTSVYIGGPLINCDGEVIGIVFHDDGYAAFLPINIASRCLQLLKRDRGVCHPWLGMTLTNSCAAKASVMEEIIQKFPHISNGIIVKDVMKGSPAAHAGIVSKDIIVECYGEGVRCSLEFCRMVWNRVSQSVEMVVMRPSSSKPVKLIMVADELKPASYNWQVLFHLIACWFSYRNTRWH
ncbi:protease Do-like 14 isoform X2 [Populus alba x Populus x berolinensis]|uniref:Protease Do-like 14 isoform X2 n=1 Tax=Populus alba x Populus x berolinensis TaxID=444605 RepID=A0AAD6PRI3_9ROSI|nr:protease Do-like 14 isoform X2 [Populus alba x Populus x berolinensis]